MRASRMNRFVTIAASALAVVASSQAQAQLYPNSEIQQLATQLEGQVQYVLQTAEQATGYGSGEQQQALNTLRMLMSASSQLRSAATYAGSNAGYNEFLQVQQLQDQAEREAYVFLYAAETIREVLDQMDLTISRLSYLYQGSSYNSGSVLQMTRALVIELSQLSQQMQSEAYGDMNKNAALRDVQIAAQDAQQLLNRVQNPYDHPSYAEREFSQVNAALNNLRSNLYYAGFSSYVHQQLAQVSHVVRQLSGYFRGYNPIHVRPLPPRRPPIRVRPPYYGPGFPGRPPVIVRPPYGPGRPGGVIVTPAPGRRPPGGVIVTPPPGRPGRPGGVIVTPAPGRRPPGGVIVTPPGRGPRGRGPGRRP